MPGGDGGTLLEAVNIHAGYGHVRVLEDVSISLKEGEIVGLIGESGSGKTTLGRLFLKMLAPVSGDIHFRGQDLRNLAGRNLKDYRRKVQMVFQNPYSSLHPLQKVGRCLEEALEIHGIGDRSSRRRDALSLLESVGLSADDAEKRPSEFSGGQRQRIAIARALALKPELIVADEPVSALDVSVQAQILNLLKDLNDAHRLAILFISHDLTVVRFLCDRVLVMYLGTIVETGDTEKVFVNPTHPYTIALLQSAPRMENAGRDDFMRPAVEGEIPGGANRPPGCPFHPRCALRKIVPDSDRCVRERPALRPVQSGAGVACHFPELNGDAPCSG